jgi:hypothetical protein
MRSEFYIVDYFLRLVIFGENVVEFKLYVDLLN